MRGLIRTGGGGGGKIFAEASYPQRYSVVPTINSVATKEAVLTAAASNAVLSARVALNALDLVTAGTSLKNRYPDVKIVEVGEALIIQSDTAITKLYAVGISTAANVCGLVINSTETDEALIRAEILEYDFEAGDNIKTVEISLGSENNALSAATVPYPLTAILSVEGFSHA